MEPSAVASLRTAAVMCSHDTTANSYLGGQGSSLDHVKVEPPDHPDINEDMIESTPLSQDVDLQPLYRSYNTSAGMTQFSPISYGNVQPQAGHPDTQACHTDNSANMIEFTALLPEDVQAVEREERNNRGEAADSDHMSPNHHDYSRDMLGLMPDVEMVEGESHFKYEADSDPTQDYTDDNSDMVEFNTSAAEGGETVQRERPFKCDICDAAFKKVSSLQRHVRVHTGEKPFKCDECGQHFADRSNLRIHFTTAHTNEKAFICDICNAPFATKAYLKLHKWKHSEDFKYWCDVCDKGFYKKNALETHRLIHTNDKPFPCEFCDMKFAQRSAYLTHKRIHTGETPFKCEECGRGFKAKRFLKAHSWIHTGEKLYQCQLCDKKFTTSSNLRTHTQKHAGVKRFFCSVCNAGFLRKADLTSHAMVHTGEKPFSCDVCSRGFARRTHLERHKKTHQPPDEKTAS